MGENGFVDANSVYELGRIGVAIGTGICALGGRSSYGTPRPVDDGALEYAGGEFFCSFVIAAISKEQRACRWEGGKGKLSKS